MSPRPIFNSCHPDRRKLIIIAGVEAAGHTGTTIAPGEMMLTSAAAGDGSGLSVRPVLLVHTPPTSPPYRTRSNYKLVQRRSNSTFMLVTRSQERAST